jgi:hypothetical protein
VDTGTILTGGGVSLGIDMTLHLIQRFLGREIAQETARILEYRDAWKANGAALPDVIELRGRVAKSRHGGDKPGDDELSTDATQAPSRRACPARARKYRSLQ